VLDAELRELERALRESPRDSALARRFLAALRRAGHVGDPPPDDAVEPLKNPGFEKGDLAFVVRRARPRAAFTWLPEMDSLVGELVPISRLERDGLGAVLEGPSLRESRWEGDPPVGRSFGFASLWRL
jgi:hypothetical protein